MVDGMEKYLGFKFLGVKCFFLEGGDVFIFMLKGLIIKVGIVGIKEVVIGMVYCGCLNVLVNVLGKNLLVLFDEFLGKYDDLLGVGDVKYYVGFLFDFVIFGGNVYLVLVFNLFYFEIVNFVVMGFVCVCFVCCNDDMNIVLFIIIYGDLVIVG